MRFANLSGRAFLLLAPIALATSAKAQPATDAVRIGRADPRIDSAFAFIKPDAPGCAVGIYRNGELSWARGYGLASVELQVPITPRTIFDLARPASSSPRR